MSSMLVRSLALIAPMLAACGRDLYDARDADIVDAGLDAAGLDAANVDAANLDDAPQIDAGAPEDAMSLEAAVAPDAFTRDAPDDAGSDANAVMAPIDLTPNPLVATDWILRPYVADMAGACTYFVDYPGEGGSPDDRIHVVLAGCPTHAPSSGDFVQYLEYQPFHFDDLVGADAFCRIDVSVDTRVDGIGVATGELELSIGVTGALEGAGAGFVTGSWFTASASLTPGVFETHADEINLAGSRAAGIDPTQPVYLVIAFRRRDWETADVEVSFDNPRYHVVFDHDGDGTCDDVDPTP